MRRPTPDEATAYLPDAAHDDDDISVTALPRWCSACSHRSPVGFQPSTLWGVLNRLPESDDVHRPFAYPEKRRVMDTVVHPLVAKMAGAYHWRLVAKAFRGTLLVLLVLQLLLSTTLAVQTPHWAAQLLVVVSFVAASIASLAEVLAMERRSREGETQVYELQRCLQHFIYLRGPYKGLSHGQALPCLMQIVAESSKIDPAFGWAEGEATLPSVPVPPALPPPSPAVVDSAVDTAVRDRVAELEDQVKALLYRVADAHVDHDHAEELAAQEAEAKQNEVERLQRELAQAQAKAEATRAEQRAAGERSVEARRVYAEVAEMRRRVFHEGAHPSADLATLAAEEVENAEETGGVAGEIM